MTLPGLTDLAKGILRRDGSKSATPFQDAHMYGDAFWARSLNWLSDLGGSMTPGALWNFAQVPDSAQGQAVTSTSAHFARHVEAFNELMYDINQGGDQFLNTIQEKRTLALEIADPAERAAELQSLRLKVMAAADTLKFLQLDQSILDKNGFQVHSIGFNKSDGDSDGRRPPKTR